MAMKDITELMNSYRECSRNLWNIYFSQQKDVGSALDAFEHIRQLLFDSLVLTELSADGENSGPPVLKVVPRASSLILIKRLAAPGGSGYWDQEKDMVVGPDDIKLQFLDYFDFSQAPVKELRYYRCRVLSFPAHVEYEGREALVEALDARIFHDE